MKSNKIFFIFLLLILFSIISLFTGSVKISFPLKTEIPRQIFYLRFQRVIFASLIGGLLSISGYLYQLVFGNPLTDPFIIGISHVCAIGTILAVSFFKWTIGNQIIFSIFLSIIYIYLFYYIINITGIVKSREKFLLFGLGLNIIFSSLLTFILVQSQQLSEIMFWMMGSLDRGNWNNIIVLLIVLLISCGIIIYFRKYLEGLHYDETIAKSSGINIESGRKIAFVVASLITAICVSYAGIIGFVGLIIPNISRKFFFTKVPKNIIFNVISGSSLLILADIISRSVSKPSIIPVGIITGFIGGIFFVTLLLVNKK